MTIPTLIFSGLCVVSGVVVFVLTGDQSITTMLLVMGGAGGTGAGYMAHRSESKQRNRADGEQARADSERRRADYWQEQTQSMMRRD